MRQILGELPAAGLLELHDLDPHVHPFQDGGQIVADAAAAHHKDVADVRGVPADELEELVDAHRGADEVDPVFRLGHEGAVGDDDLAVAVGGAEQDGQALDTGGQIGEGLPQKEVALPRAKAHKLHPAAVEGLNVGGGGEPEQPGNLHGGGPLRVDEQVNAHVTLEGVDVHSVLHVADPGHGETGAQVLGVETADHIDLVQTGGGDEHVGVLGACLPQHADGGTVALDTHDIQRVVGLPQSLTVVVDDGNIMVLL